MPELPEVETIRIGLQKKIVGLKISKIQIISPKSFIGNPNSVKGQKVLKVWRRAKYLGIDLGSLSLLFHLKMTGQLIWKGGGENLIGGHPTPDMLGKMPNSHTRVIFSFSDGSSYVSPKAKGKVPRSGFLYFNDQRRFGWVRIVNSGQLTVDSSLKNLGPELLEKEFTWEVLKENLLRHKSMPVKVAIMDQKVVSGIGNIYASESCFNGKIDPRTKVGEMEDVEFKAIHQGMIKAINDGIKYGGATRAHFVDPEGHKGYFLDYAFVYGRNKHPCKICGTEIKKIILGGRGTYLCPKCQS